MAPRGETRTWSALAGLSSRSRRIVFQVTMQSPFPLIRYFLALFLISTQGLGPSRRPTNAVQHVLVQRTVALSPRSDNFVTYSRNSRHYQALSSAGRRGRPRVLLRPPATDAKDGIPWEGWTTMYPPRTKGLPRHIRRPACRTCTSWPG